MASRKLCTWNAIFLVPWVLYSLLESHNPFDIWESTPTVAHNSCCHVSSRHGTHGKTCVFCSCAWYCHWQGRVGAERCWQPHMCICVLTYEYIHTCDYIGSDTDAEMQRCREDKGESTAAGGWEVRRSSRPSVQVCLDECGSAVLFDVPPSWLMDCGRVELSGLLTSHSSTRWIWCLLTVRHTAVTMNPGWWERGARTERSWKSRMVSCIQLHYLFGVCGVFEVSFRFGSMCRSKLTLKQRHFDFVLQKTFWSLSYEKKSVWTFSALQEEMIKQTDPEAQCKYSPLLVSLYKYMPPMQRGDVMLRFSTSWNFSVRAPTEQTGGQKVRKQTK